MYINSISHTVRLLQDHAIRYMWKSQSKSFLHSKNVILERLNTSKQNLSFGKKKCC